MGLSRACTIATRINPADPRVMTLAHACCEGNNCECACHRAMLRLTAMPNDPLPIITEYPPNAQKLVEDD